LKRHPYLAAAYRERAHARWRLARGPGDVSTFHLTAAHADLARALALRPAWAVAWTDRGWIHYMRDERDDARRAFEHAISLDPADVRVGMAHAEYLFRVGQSDQALQELRRIRRYNPEWSETMAQDFARRWRSNLK